MTHKLASSTAQINLFHAYVNSLIEHLQIVSFTQDERNYSSFQVTTVLRKAIEICIFT